MDYRALFEYPMKFLLKRLRDGYRSFQHWIRYVNGLMMQESPSLNVIPAVRCICLTCRISTAFLMPKSIINDVISSLRWQTLSRLRCWRWPLTSAINASSLTVKAFLDIQDDNLPKLVVCQSLFSGAGLSFQAVPPGLCV